MSKSDAELTNQPEIIFTRYLYIKDEVELSLITSILDKKDRAIFWAYELYYSGFEIGLFNLLWKIYFDFYYTLNPAFYDYFIKKQKEWIKLQVGMEKDKIIHTLVSNMLIRPHNLDVFMLRQIVKCFDVEFALNFAEKSKELQFIEWFNERNYLDIAEFVINKSNQKQLEEILDFAEAYFNGAHQDSKKPVEHKINKNINIVKIKKRHMILAFIMMRFSVMDNMKQGKNFYVIVEENEVKPYETINYDYDSSFYPYKILPVARLHTIDEDDYLSLFNLDRSRIDISNAYFRHWEYYASYSPVWDKRIKNFKGIVNCEKKQIEFPNDDYFDDFYDAYNYETDEQRPEITNKSIQLIKQRRTWKQFYEEHKNGGLFIPYEEFLSEFDKLEY